MRIALVAVQHESNPRSPFRTELSDFSNGCLLRGPALIEHWRRSRHELAGIIQAAAERPDLEIVPLLAAWAVPGGAVTTDAFETIAADATALVAEAGAACDALLVVLHGAMWAEHAPDADGELLERLRRVWGQKPMVVTVDFHANVTRRMAACCNALLAYRTNPHIDQFEVGKRAVETVLRLVEHQEPYLTVVGHPSCLISIACQNTADSPWPDLFGRLDRAAERLGAVTANLCAGFPYADLPEAGPSISFSGPAGLREQLRQGVAECCELVFRRRGELYRSLLPPSEVPAALRRTARKPVIVVDFGDNIGGGAPGDGTLLLHILGKARVPGVLACLWDPRVVQACSGRTGQEVEVEIGGKWCPEMGAPLVVRARVAAVSDGRWHEPGVMHGGLSEWDQGPTVLLEPAQVRAGSGAEGGQEWCAVSGWQLVVNSRRTPPFSRGQVESAGADVGAARVIVVKAAIAYRAAYGPIAGEIVEVETPGPTANDVRLLSSPVPNDGAEPFRALRRPIYPLDPI